jgi:hypothetical protein
MLSSRQVNPSRHGTDQATKSSTIGPSRPIYYIIRTNTLNIYLYTICSRVQIKHEDNSRVVAAFRFANWAEKHEPKWPMPSQMRPMSSDLSCPAIPFCVWSSTP